MHTHTYFLSKLYTNTYLSTNTQRFDRPGLTASTADAPASGTDKKKTGPENCYFFLPNRFHLTLIFKLQRRNACPIILLPRNSCMNTICFFSTLD